MWRVNKKLLFIFVLVCVAVFNLSATNAAETDEIEVALYIADIESVPTVSLSADSNLTVSSVQNESYFISDRMIKGSRDVFTLKLPSTTDYSEAVSWKTTLQSQTDHTYILISKANGESNYTVYGGSYSQYEDAKKMKEKIQSTTSSLSSIDIAGNYHIAAGEYTTASSAKEAAANWQQQGIPAYAGMFVSSNANGYTVFLGEESSSNALEQLKSNVKNIDSSTNIETVSTSDAYILIKDDATISSGIARDHYFYSDATKMQVSSEDPIKVIEKNGRQYRGMMELSTYKNELALVNVLPIEQYLYSVVGSEMYGNWPIEALKAQAVSARTYALMQGVKYDIANVSDTTRDQAYSGVTAETTGSIQSVQMTEGEVLVDASSDKMITPFYSSNAGGMTSDPSEVWESDIPYLTPVASPDDSAGDRVREWHRIVLQNGTVGYTSTELLTSSGKNNNIGLPIYQSNTSAVNVRPAPFVAESNAPIHQLQLGEKVIVLDTVQESNAYSWIYGPYSEDQLALMIEDATDENISSISSLEVSKRGTSGRVTEIKLNGDVLEVKYPDYYRTVFGGLRSTRFEIENMGEYYVMSGNGQATKSSSSSMVALNGDGEKVEVYDETFFVMDADENISVKTQSDQYQFVGTGFGHGLGMSQYGAKQFADLGYDYKYILQYYYQGVEIKKG
ncbi:SpoIID/LytB domain-containing protein [Longirhabdus pacifica]|uniref:SpoIID/LytB domain-containing protein n=1 Tax=Longirhabdus pacifica TaxID=2305227 RepID=UPI001008F555|nr:SpoIID/LytB domain-containing protein [Longirhabdus pacifica]